MTYVARNTPEGAAATEPKEAENPPSSGTSFFNQISPKSALTVGLITSILAIGTIGFIILLTIFIRDAG